MLEQTYSKWLENDVMAMQYALLVALEKKDTLLYIDEPALREEYMQKIGVYEERVLKAELELSLQEKKKQLIQTALNRREAIDLDVIDKILEEERKQQLEQLNQTYKRETVHSNLTFEEREELQNLYKDIVRDFHPEVHKDITDFQKQLYQRAVVAYQKQQLEALRLVHEMLYAKEEGEFPFEISVDVEMKIGTELVESLMEDYSLAAELYPCFETLEKDGILISTKQQYEEKEKTVWLEIEQIQTRFPFIAKETLRNEEKLKAYLESLNGRMNIAKEDLERLQVEIQLMIESRG